MLMLYLAFAVQPIPGHPAHPPAIIAGREPIYSAREAIAAAADAEGAGVPGLFHMRVRNAGWDRGRLFLNSELDYRDQRSLNIAISRPALIALAERFSENPESVFRGRTVQVRGRAMRTRITFFSQGRDTGLYYYQTQVEVTDPDQIVLID